MSANDFLKMVSKCQKTTSCDINGELSSDPHNSRRWNQSRRRVRQTAITAGSAADQGTALQRLHRGYAGHDVAWPTNVWLPRCAPALVRSWTVAELAAEAALSRSAVFARFSGAVSVAPMRVPRKSREWEVRAASSFLVGPGCLTLRRESAILAERASPGLSSSTAEELLCGW